MAVTGGLITEENRNNTVRAWLSAEGQRVSLDFLGLTSLPLKLTWSSLQDKYLLPRLFDIQPINTETRRRVSSLGGLRAAIIRRCYALPIERAPTETQAIDALLWKELGVESNKKFGLTAVKEFLISRLLGLNQPVEFRKIKGQVAAKAIKARRSDKTGLRLAAIRHWLDETADPGDSPRADIPTSSETTGIHDFVGEVIETARQSATGWFGKEKIFIAHVYRCYRERFPHRSIDMAAFKNQLIQAHRQKLLTLSRADLVEAMPHQDVAESETTYLNARYHFIRIPGA